MSRPIEAAQTRTSEIEPSASAIEAPKSSEAKDDDRELDQESGSDASNESANAAREAFLQSLVTPNHETQVAAVDESVIDEDAGKDTSFEGLENLPVAQTQTTSEPLTESSLGTGIEQTTLAEGPVDHGSGKELSKVTTQVSDLSEAASAEVNDTAAVALTTDTSAQETVGGLAESSLVAGNLASQSDTGEDRDSRRSSRRDRHDRDKTSVTEPANQELASVKPVETPQATSPSVEAAMPVPPELQPAEQIPSVEANLATTTAPAVAAATTTTTAAVSRTSASKAPSSNEGTAPIQSSNSVDNSRSAGTQKSNASQSSSANDAVIRAKLVQRVSKAFQHLGTDGGTIRLRLAPAELGSVRVEMQIQGRKVNARVVAETESASTILRDHLADLRSRLESQGMQIESFEIETDEQSFSSSSDLFGQNGGAPYQGHAHDDRYSASQQNSKIIVSRVVSQVTDARDPVLQTAGVDVRF